MTPSSSSLLILIILGTVGCTSEGQSRLRAGEQIAFDEIARSPSTSALNNFIATYPDSQYLPGIRRLLADCAFTDAKALNTVDTYRGFLAEYAASRHCSEVRDRLATLRYQEAVRENSINGYRSFIDEFSADSRVAEAHGRIEDLEYENLRKSATTGDLERFLKCYPDGKYRDDINERLAATYYKETVAANTIVAFDSFLERFSETRLARDAQTAREKLVEAEFRNHADAALQQAMDTDDDEGYLSVIAKYRTTSAAETAGTKLRAFDCLVVVDEHLIPWSSIPEARHGVDESFPYGFDMTSLDGTVSSYPGEEYLHIGPTRQWAFTRGSHVVFGCIQSSSFETRPGSSIDRSQSIMRAKTAVLGEFTIGWSSLDEGRIRVSGVARVEENGLVFAKNAVVARAKK